jgi:lipase (class 3)
LLKLMTGLRISPFLPIVLVLAGPASAGDAPPRGANVFTTAFRHDAAGRNDLNAYLLMYLTTLIYPEHLDEVAAADLSDRRLNADPAYFQKQFEKNTRHLFFDAGAPAGPANAPPEYQFVSYTESGGYDPEAMVITTPKAVYVVFRGTDRVASAKSGFGYQWSELLKTDFSFLGTPPGDGLRGTVHMGFWNSLSLIKRQLAERVIQGGGKTKKVWICGHSLGAGYTQLFAAYLNSKHGITAQGAYAFAAPHVGDDSFVSELTGMFPSDRLQRFDFVDDPVTMLPPYVTLYKRAGTRNYFSDLKTYKFKADERAMTDESNFVTGLFGAIGNAIQGAITKNAAFKISLSGGAFCYHHPTWYLAAAYRQLNRAEKAKVPPPLKLPSQKTEACSVFEIARARSSKADEQVDELVDQAAASAKEGVDKIAFNVKSLLDNATGSAIADGTYTIRCHKGGKYLTWHEPFKDGAKVDLRGEGKSEKDNRYKIKKLPAGGYTIESSGKFLEVDADDLFDNGTKVQMWSANLPFSNHGANQIWLFYKVRDDRYLILCSASLKVLDANNNDPAKDGCGVKQWEPLDNDQTQVWIVDKAR